jgi:hypothetical protein
VSLLFVVGRDTDWIATIKGWKDLIQQEMSWMDLVSLPFNDWQQADG